MNIRVRRAAARGVSSLSWLDSRHTFSFGGYRDPSHMGFRALRVLNDDRVSPGGGFARHAHENMEILTWVIDGALAHADSIGNGSTIGFKCNSPDQVRQFHDTAVAHGGTSIENPPGLREGKLGAMYLAYVRDPDGNKLCALHRPK